jgi:hypothetical protein
MKQTTNDWKLSKFNLSAFPSAARIITLVMQKEYDKAAGFKKWYKFQQEVQTRHCALMKNLMRMR